MSERGAARTASPSRGLVTGLLFGVAAGALWVVLVVVTSSRQPFLTLVVAVAVAYGVHRGGRNPGRRAALTAVGLTAAILLVAAYWVERFLIVSAFSDAGDAIEIPKVPYLDWWWAVIRHAADASTALVLFFALSLVVAGFFGHQGFDHDDEVTEAVGDDAGTGARRA